MKEDLAQRAGSALFWQAVQQAGVHIIFLVRLLILARLLSPIDFGLMAIAMTAIGFLLKITDFGMVPALVQRSDLHNQHYHVAWSIGIIRALTIACLVFLASPIIAKIFAEPRVINIIRVLAILPLIEAAASIKIADLTRNLRFRSLAFVKLPEVLANTIVSIVLAPLLGVWALVAGSLTGPAAYLVMSYIMAPHLPKICFDKDAMSPLINYGRWIFLTSLIAISGATGLRIIISRQLGVTELGIYFLAAKLAFLPTGIANEVVGEVAFPLYARLKKNVVEAAYVFRTIFTGMIVVLVPIFILMIVLAPSLVENVLGPRWEGTVLLIRLLALVGIAGLIGDAVVPVLKGLGKPNKFAALEASQSILLIVFAWVFAVHFGLVGAVLAWFPAIIGSMTTGMVFLIQLLPRPFEKTGASLIAISCASGIGAIVALGVDYKLKGVFGFFLAILLSVLVIGSLIWILDRRFNIGLKNNFVKAFPQISALLNLSPNYV
ncbi:MAG: lipopolysaccharide biosynthesis protein [Planctomycetota bacterium]|jgi:PST family polysaccharide transporter/lipopolysaccharide exporter